MSDVKYQILTASELREVSKKVNDEIFYNEVFHKIKSAADSCKLSYLVEISRDGCIDLESTDISSRQYMDITGKPYTGN